MRMVFRNTEQATRSAGRRILPESISGQRCTNDGSVFDRQQYDEQYNGHVVGPRNLGMRPPTTRPPLQFKPILPRPTPPRPMINRRMGVFVLGTNGSLELMTDARDEGCNSEGIQFLSYRLWFS